MIDPTAPTDLSAPLKRIDPDTDPEFAARAAHYLRTQGLDSPAIVLALRTELGLPTSEAIRLAGGQLSPIPSTTEQRVDLVRPRHGDRGTDSPWRGPRPLTPINLIVEPIAN